MPTPIPIVGQYIMDAYYQNYKEDSEFFSLSDFIFHGGATVGDYMRQEYDKARAELRQEKSDEVVGFSEDLLVPVDIKVVNGVAVIPDNNFFMSFLYDRQTSGIQKIIVTKPSGYIQLERSNLFQIWQARYTTKSEVIYWYYDRGSIKFFTNGSMNVQEITMLYVPGVTQNMLVPDSLIDWTVSNTVQKMHQMKQGIVVKKSIDGNQNALPETEINKMSAK
jgi:hypothetical protein